MGLTTAGLGRFGTWGILAVGCFVTEITMVEAQSDSIGLTVGISLATSLVTTLLTILIVYLIHRFCFKSRLKRDGRDRMSGVSAISDGSTRPLSSAREISYAPVTTGERINGDVATQPRATSRIKSDFISKWCTEHRLTEFTASVLRQAGFTTREAVESLRLPDIDQFKELNKAQQCLLREAISPKMSQSESAGSGVFRQRSSSVEDTPSPMAQTVSLSPTGSGFDRVQSLDHIDGVLPRPAFKKKKSYEVIETEESDVSHIVIYNRSNSRPNLPDGMVPVKSNPKNFRGLLSDEGLYDLAAMIGVERTHLATLLKIPGPKQEHIMMDFPNNVRQQIFEMLKYWRDRCDGSKEQVKGKLHAALVKCGRRDLGEDLLQEQVEGSCEKVGVHSIV